MAHLKNIMAYSLKSYFLLLHLSIIYGQDLIERLHINCEYLVFYGHLSVNCKGKMPLVKMEINRN